MKNLNRQPPKCKGLHCCSVCPPSSCVTTIMCVYYHMCPPSCVSTIMCVHHHVCPPSIFRLCRIADKMLLKAKDELLAGDEEQAYILYMRFIDMYKVIRASKEFKKDKSEINQLLPTSKVHNYVSHVMASM